jgi:hypothetical protein
MNIIFLDDDLNRWKRFRSKVPQAVHVETAASCIKLIKDTPVIDWLFLDHDLGGEAYVKSYREDCGMEVVRYLCAENRNQTIHNIVVHSHNAPAAQEMFNKLIDAGYKTQLVPFYSLVDAISVNLDAAT